MPEDNQETGAPVETPIEATPTEETPVADPGTEGVIPDTEVQIPVAPEVPPDAAPVSTPNSSMSWGDSGLTTTIPFRTQ